MEDARPPTPRGTPRSSGIDMDQRTRGSPELPFRNLKDEIAHSGKNTALNTPRSGRSTTANTPRSPRAGPSLKEQLTPRSLKEKITPRSTPRAASPFLDQTTPRGGASTPRACKSPQLFASGPIALLDQAPADEPSRSPSQSPPEAPSPDPQQQQQQQQTEQHHAIPPEQLARRLHRISLDIPQDLPISIALSSPPQSQSPPDLQTAMTLALEELLEPEASLYPRGHEQLQPTDADHLGPLLGLGRAASLIHAESSIANWWRSGLRRRSTMGETLLIIPRLSISEAEEEGEMDGQAEAAAEADDSGSGQAAAAVESAAATAAPGVVSGSDTSVTFMAAPPVTAAPTPVVEHAAAAAVTPLMDVATAPPAVRTSVRRASRRKVLLGTLTLLLAGSACLMMFYMSPTISAIVSRVMPVTPGLDTVTVLPPLAPPGQWNDIQLFLGWQQPAWQEIERVDLTQVADKPTMAQCAQWAAMPAMQVLCTGANPLKPSPT